jgi:hypothetical protein
MWVPCCLPSKQTLGDREDVMKTRVNISFEVAVWLDWVCAFPVMVYRLVRYGYTFRRIALSQDKFAIVDAENFYQLNQFRWYACKTGSGAFYAVRMEGRRQIGMHRQILWVEKGLVVDHRNGNTLDNRKANLRPATKTQNRWNCGKQGKPASSRFKGVYWSNRYKQWSAMLRFNKQRIALGLFDSEIDAAKAYDEAAKKYHGEFARLNLSR